MGTYSVQAQVRYIVQWFGEWSDLQRSDFLTILAERLSPHNYMNGLVTELDGLNCEEKRPPSLFQCRIKLFKEWSTGWGNGEREQLLNEIERIDAEFIKKLNEIRNPAEINNSENTNTENLDEEVHD